MNEASDSQEAIFAFLCDPATHGGSDVKRIDTHAASLFLADEWVLKVKRAVRFPFLDFSTLEKRKAACDTELAINRRTAPDIYRRVIAITREADGTLAIGGRGEPVEWAVEMRRFDERLTLDHLAAAGKIDAALADALGRTVAQSHAKAPPAEAARWIMAVESYIDEHVQAFGEHPRLFPAGDVGLLAQAARASFARIRPILEQRGRQGLIRRIHGDLHLGNIVLLHDRPVLFDAIEFSDIIASGDVLYDLAFLLMDLIERKLEAAANIVFNRYFLETRRDADIDALAALPFFLSMRAAIRAKVAAARLDVADAGKHSQIECEATAYFEWARRFIAPPPPKLVAVGGLSGTGKSVLARALAADCTPAPGALVLRSDVERKALFGKGEFEPLGPRAYNLDANSRVYAAIVEKARRAVAAGHSAIVDAVFARPDERAAVEEAARSQGVAFNGLFLVADVDRRAQRITERVRDASDATPEIVRAQESYELGALAWPRIDASGTPDATLSRAKAALR
jgi:aminoglycoside phosphotransferase family enzyme/predicted kinase